MELIEKITELGIRTRKVVQELKNKLQDLRKDILQKSKDQ